MCLFMGASSCCVFKDLRVMKVQEQVDSEMAKAGVTVLLMGAEGVFYLFKIIKALGAADLRPAAEQI